MNVLCIFSKQSTHDFRPRFFCIAVKHMYLCICNYDNWSTNVRGMHFWCIVPLSLKISLECLNSFDFWKKRLKCGMYIFLSSWHNPLSTFENTVIQHMYVCISIYDWSVKVRNALMVHCTTFINDLSWGFPSLN